LVASFHRVVGLWQGKRMVPKKKLPISSVAEPTRDFVVQLKRPKVVANDGVYSASGRKSWRLSLHNLPKVLATFAADSVGADGAAGF